VARSNRANEWRVRYNQDLYGDMHVITHMKMGRLRWAGHLIGINDNNQQNESL
jgi:hypothetical protein